MINWKLSSDTWDQNEKTALERVMKSGMYTMGKEVKEFEKRLAEMHGVKHAIMTNSGSSANLLMMTALKEHPQFNTEPRKRFLRSPKRKNVIVPAVSWSTTYFPVHQNGFDLKFVDVDLFTMNIDVEKVVEAIDEDTVAILAVNLLGNPAQLAELDKICSENNITLLEDNCESFGAKYVYNGNAKVHTGTIGKMGTLSFFFSHHLQTMEGGCVFTNDDSLADYLRSLRAHGWVRDLSENSDLYKKSGNPFDDSFVFVLPGYCVRPLEFSGAVGQEQIKKWPLMMRMRTANAVVAKEYLNTDRFRLQEEIGESSWFGFGILLIGELEGRREEVIAALAAEGVEARPIVAGNFTKNPVIDRLNTTKIESYPNADYIDKNGFFLGNDWINLASKIKKVSELLEKL